MKIDWGRGIIIHESLIILNLKSRNKEEIIRNLARKAEKLGCISDFAGYMQAVFAVEKLFPTVIGYGIAIPLGESEFVQIPFIAFAKSDEGFIWDSRTDQEVRLIFLIGVPEEKASDLYFKMLAKVSRGLMNKSYRERLVQSTNVKEVVGMFDEMGF